MSATSVKVSEEIEPMFEEAENYVKKYFEDQKQDPTLGIITIQGERYILMRAHSMSVNIFNFIKQMYPALNKREAINASSRVLFDIAHSIGLNDAKEFHKRTNVEDPIAKLSTGPVHFAYTGWAFVDISSESKPSPDENYYLLYDHPQSFEADSWISSDEKVDFCVCVMNAGYSSGWCEASFGLTLVAEEILCRAKGDDYCRFIMSPPEKLSGYIQAYKQKHQDIFKS